MLNFAPNTWRIPSIATPVEMPTVYKDVPACSISVAFNKRLKRLGLFKWWQLLDATSRANSGLPSPLDDYPARNSE